MKKKTTEISTNVSSGAEKVETIEKETKKKVTPVAKENERAKERVDRALKKKENKEKRLAERKARIEKRLAEKKARAEKHSAERKKIAEERAKKKEQKLREHARKKANKNRANARKKEGRENNKSKRQGYGGWIAAVVTLGVVSLALAGVVTVGAVDMQAKNSMLSDGYRSTMYELTGTMEHVDADLDRVRVSASPEQQGRILTDLLVQSRLAEQDLEKLPMSAEETQGVSGFINRIASECERMLSKLRRGESLDKKDGESLEKLYVANHGIRAKLDEMMNTMTDKDLGEYMKKGAGMIKDAFDKLEETTLQENRSFMEGMKKEPAPPVRQQDEDELKIEPVRAEELCKQYFADYNVQDFQCVGETVTKGFSAYNVQGYDDKGTMLYAEIDRKTGALVVFDYYEECMEERFDMGNAEALAEAFLEKLGYDDMDAVRVRTNGSTAVITYAYEDDDVVYYPDEIVVKVCRTRGVVTGLDATKYLQNHRDRDEMNPKISLQTAKDKLHEALTVEASRLAVVKANRGERLAYEFYCSYGDENYFVFLDAMTGDEISIVNARAIQ